MTRSDSDGKQSAHGVGIRKLHITGWWSAGRIRSAEIHTQARLASYTDADGLSLDLPEDGRKMTRIPRARIDNNITRTRRRDESGRV